MIEANCRQADAPGGHSGLAEARGARLVELHRNGRRPVLVVDAAQLASPPLLEEIRLRTNHEDRQDTHLHVVLDVAGDQE